MQEPNKTPTLEMCTTDKLLPYAGNARKHSNRQLNQLVASLREFGFVNPVLIDANNMIIAGHGRVAKTGLAGCLSPLIKSGCGWVIIFYLKTIGGVESTQGVRVMNAQVCSVPKSFKVHLGEQNSAIIFSFINKKGRTIVVVLDSHFLANSAPSKNGEFLLQELQSLQEK